ncbi:Type 1 glutamine amidotransferase-like domain-containing protein [Candidatus Woesearchaeota archaeon]|nr:Type 1 glutamine amidotransferase-like domain-containing protein [Candidatus Woesearchaeota archaeon]
MKFYLSSYKIGNKGPDLVRLLGKNKHIGYIPNACDYTNANLEKKNAGEKADMESLEMLGLEVEYLDLKVYFGKTDELREKIRMLGGVFVRGGNTFILRQAMRLSGFEIIFKELLKRDEFVYAGYSAGICVLAPDFKGIQTVDDPKDMPYDGMKETIWEGLGFLNYMILPHYRSDHPESAAVELEVKFCRKNRIPFKTMRDGEVMIIE